MDSESIVSSQRIFRYTDDFNREVEMVDISEPSFQWTSEVRMSVYVVQEWEEGRIDLVMDSIYGSDINKHSDADVILYINGIDNPLSIRRDMQISYPADPNMIYMFRTGQEINTLDGPDDITKQLGVPNKTTRTDPNRKNFVDNGYSLPPTVNPTPSAPVKLNDTSIVVGGIRN
jgi:hypothetical protein